MLIMYDKLRWLCKKLICDNKSSKCMLDKYRKRVHESNNQLLIINGLLDNKEELEEYISYLIDVNIDDDYIGELNNINIPGVKDFINRKLIILKELNTDIELYVSNEISNIEYGFNIDIIDKLYTILGVLLDNVIDVIKLCNKKLVSILVYLDNDCLCFEIANTYVGNIDIEKIRINGYSTKGEGRGIGLYMVDNIVKRSNIFNLCGSIVDEFFVQVLKIKLKRDTI